MSTPDLFTRTRRDDPATSHEAAQYIHPKLPRLQGLVMDWARIQSQFTDKQLVNAMQFGYGGTESTWRTRRAELRDAGLIVECGKTADHKGKHHTLWRVV